MAHEIRNPLTALMGFTQLLQTKNEAYKSYYEIMEVELKRINSIIDEFVQLSKPRVTLFKEHDVCTLVDNLEKVLHPQAAMNNVEMIIEKTDENTIIHCDEFQLKQVFMNVMRNAIDAMPIGGTLRVLFTKQQDCIRVCFKDEGVGIPKEKLSKIGEPFTTKDTGTGLGLSVSYKIIEAHRGEMYFESEVGRGTSVHIYLPLARQDQSNA